MGHNGHLGLGTYQEGVRIMKALNEIFRPAIGLVDAMTLAGGLSTSVVAQDAEETFTENEIVDATADFFDITSEAAAEVVARSNAKAQCRPW